jgi:hypothetical protein
MVKISSVLKIASGVLVVFMFGGCSDNRSATKSFTPEQSKRFSMEQHKAIRRSREPFKKRSLLGYEEKKVFWELESALRGSGYFVAPQISLGEILAHPTLYRTINSKRVDFCIVDRNFMPVLVVEYDGKGHYQNNYKIRDSIKEDACLSAGIKFVSITYKDNVRFAIQAKVLPHLAL